jgi:hypothetical protein
MLTVAMAWAEWIDISLVVNDRFLPLFFQFLHHKDLRDQVSSTNKKTIARR